MITRRALFGLLAGLPGLGIARPVAARPVMISWQHTPPLCVNHALPDYGSAGRLTGYATDALGNLFGQVVDIVERTDENVALAKRLLTRSLGHAVTLR